MDLSVQRPRPLGGRGLAAFFVALLAALVVLAPGGAGAASTVVTSGNLVWGVKESWRNYVGTGTLGGGASVNPDGTYDFPVASGSYDDETKTTTLQFTGSVHWRAYPDYPVPGRWGLDTTFKDLSLEIGPTAQVIRGTTVGYSRDDPGGDLHTEVGVVIAKLDVAGATTSFAGGVSQWSAVPAVAGPGLGLYPQGTAIDPVTFSYDGPGGVPDLGEKWDSPGGVGLEPGARWLSAKPVGTDADSGRQIYVSPGGEIVHLVELTGGGTAGALLTFTALDAETLTQIGQQAQVTYPVANAGQFLKTAFDPATESIFFATGGGGASQQELTVRVASWNPGTPSYDLGTLGRLRDNKTIDSMVWNPVAHELAVVNQINAAEGAGTYVKNELSIFRLVGGAWVKALQKPLPMPGTGPYAGGASATTSTPFACGSKFIDSKCLGVLRDGSYLQAPGSSRTVVGGVTLPWPAVRVEIVAGEVETSRVEGTALAPDSAGTRFGYNAVSQGADGSAVLHRTIWLPTAFARVDAAAGDATLVGQPYNVSQHGDSSALSTFGAAMAADPSRGLEWIASSTDPDGFVLSAMSGGGIVSRFKYPELFNQGYGLLGVSPDGAVYIPVKDTASGRFGYQRLDYLGRRATVAEQPDSVDVDLAAGEAGKPVSFSSAASGGSPAPTRQWQLRAPGASAFADVEGETGQTLTIEAQPGMDGSEVRAVYSSPAGKIVSTVATLGVDYAPRLLADLQNRSVTEGSDAVFLLAADGDPEPAISWQRRVGGFWQDIDTDDDNFAVNGPSLTVLDTNVEQSGALFRAKLSNSLGTAFSRAAKLTVTPRVSIPEGGLDLENVSLEWTGNPEMQHAPPFGGSDYFSAGFSDGKEGTYRSLAGNAAVYQVAPSGTEALASWATRAGHIGGGEQLVRLFGGEAEIESDGSADVEWTGAFSVNFYGGLVPFTLIDPRLSVDDDGSGTLTADMSGCASSQANPNQCTQFVPVANVTVATFSGVEIDPAGEITIVPDYAGVEVSVSVPFAPQSRTGTGWGGWPQSFVDFHAKTGLAPYWYSSGGSFDPLKPPNPFVVDFQGDAPPAASRPGGQLPGSPPPGPLSGRDKQAAIAPLGKIRRVGGRGLVAIARLSCPAEGPCRVIAPMHVRVEVAGSAYWADVIAPDMVRAGGYATVKVRLPEPALQELGDIAARVRLPLKLRSSTGTTRRVLSVEVRRRY